MRNLSRLVVCLTILPTLSLASTIEEYTFFEYRYSWGGPGFSYLNSDSTGEPYLVSQFENASSSDFSLFLQFDGLVGLDAVAGESFAFGNGTNDPKTLF